MIQPIVDVLQTLVSYVGFADVVVGIAHPMKVKYGDMLKTIPAYYNSTKETCKTNDYMNLVPNSTKRSMIYFEDMGTTMEQATAHYNIYNTTVRLVCWMNFKLIDPLQWGDEAMIEEILSKIPVNYGNYQNVARIQFKVNAVISNTAEIFYRYTYDEVDNQYMTYPYYAVGIDINARYQISNLCITPLPLNPDVCLR